MTRSPRATVEGDLVVLPDGRSLALDSDEAAAFLASAHALTIAHAEGDYLAVREKRARGGLYWVGRTYVAGRRASAYLGRTIDPVRLDEAGTELAAKVASTTPPIRRHRSPAVAQVPSADPVAMHDLLADLLAAEADPERRRALEDLERLVAAQDPTR